MENDVMQKKFLISLGLIAVMSCGLQAYANTTVYTDELGRMHFLGKDDGAKTLQKLDDYDNPKQVDILPNTTYGRNNVDYYEVTNIKSIEKKENGVYAGVNRTKSTYSSEKGAMDASNPYTQGGTNVDTTTNKKPADPLNVDNGNLGKKFWQLW